MRYLICAITFLVAWTLFAESATGSSFGPKPADPTESAVVWSWKTTEGTLCFTDNEKRIPRAYKRDARTFTIDDLRQRTDRRFTPIDSK